jgi:hypothetical protein
MTRKQDELYREMMEALERAQGVGMPAPADRSYWIACDYWEQLKKITPNAELENEATAIEFFRNTKTKFTSQVQYATMLSEVLLFVPEHSDEKKLYWKGEQKRYGRFYEKNSEFIDYYNSDKHHMDALYFTRVRADNISEPRMRYDEDIRFCSGKDHIVRGVLAHLLYKDFVTEQLRLITSRF